MRETQKGFLLLYPYWCFVNNVRVRLKHSIQTEGEWKVHKMLIHTKQVLTKNVFAWRQKACADDVICTWQQLIGYWAWSRRIALLLCAQV